MTVKNEKISFDFSIGTHATSIDQNLKIKFLKCHLLLRGNLKWPFIVASRRSESERGNGFFTFLSLKRWKVKGTEVFFSPRNIAHQKNCFQSVSLIEMGSVFFVDLVMTKTKLRP